MSDRTAHYIASSVDAALLPYRSKFTDTEWTDLGQELYQQFTQYDFDHDAMGDLEGPIGTYVHFYIVHPGSPSNPVPLETYWRKGPGCRDLYRFDGNRWVYVEAP